MPPPPSQELKENNLKLYNILSRLYSCMDNVIETQSNNREQDLQKFKKIKELYLQLLSKTELKKSLVDCLADISAWENLKDTSEIIDGYRSPSVFSWLFKKIFNTNTRNCIESIKAECQRP